MVMKFLVFHSTKILIFHWFFFSALKNWSLHAKAMVVKGSKWLSKKVAARRAKYHSQKSLDNYNTTTTTFIGISMNRWHCRLQYWLCQGKGKKKKVTFIIVNNNNNNNNTVMAKITRKMLINYIVARDVGVVGAVFEWLASYADTSLSSSRD